MDKTTLVGPDIEEGRRFLELLNSEGVGVDAALWQKDEWMGRWDLTIVTPLVKEVGVRATYSRLDEILSKASDRPAVDLLNVRVMTPDAHFFKSLRRELRQARNMAISRQPVGDHIVEVGFIYFVK